MIVIVGHGPSATRRGKGSVIDSAEVVVRMKTALTDPVHRGVKTSYICSRGSRHRREGVPFFLLPKKPHIVGENVYPYAKWHDFYRRFGRSAVKPSTGLQTIFAVMEFLKPAELYLVGFDWLLNPDTAPKGSHDWRSENACVKALGIPVHTLERAWES